MNGQEVARLSERQVQDIAVTIAALLAGRIDGQQAVQTTAAQVERILAARVEASEALAGMVRALAEEWETADYADWGGDVMRDCGHELRALLGDSGRDTGSDG